MKQKTDKSLFELHQEVVEQMQEESHYFHTINDFVDLIERYGWDMVMTDLRGTMGERQW